MSDYAAERREHKAGNAMFGWVGLIFGLIGLFALPYWMGFLAVILGIIDMLTPSRSLGIAAIIIGFIDVIFPLFLLALLL